MTDRELLEQYAGGQRDAFRELVTRNLDMVHAAARRQAGHAADDVVQAVFLLLAQKAKNISPKTSVAGWLYQAVRYCCANLKKMENRRRHYEREAAAMATHTKDPGWENLLPLLDQAMETLGHDQRDAVLLRYLEAKTIDQAAQELGISADAVAKRAGRGLEKLRAYFAKQGYATPVAGIAGLMAAEAAKAAPPAMTGLLQTAFTGASPAASPSVISLLNGAQTMLTLAKIKSLAAIAALCLLGSALVAVVVAQALAPTPGNATAQPAHATTLAVNTTQFAATAPAATQPAIEGSPLIATLPSGVVVELVAIAHHPIDINGWWRPDGSAMTSPVPQGLMTVQMIGTRAFPGHKTYNFFIRYHTPSGRQQVLDARADDDISHTVRRGIGSDHLFEQLVIPMSATATSGAIRVSIGMDAVETLLDTRTPTQPGQATPPATGGKKITFRPSVSVNDQDHLPQMWSIPGQKKITSRPSVDDQGRYAIAIECPTDLLGFNFVRPVATVQGKTVTETLSADRLADTPSVGTTRLDYVFDIDPALVDRFQLEVYRPVEYALFTHVSLGPKTRTSPAAEAKTGDRLSQAARRD